MTSAPTIAAQPKNKAWRNQSAEDVFDAARFFGNWSVYAGDSTTPRG